MSIHIARNGESFGPYTRETIDYYLAEGSVSLDDIAWTEGGDGWVSLESLLGATSSTVRQATATKAKSSAHPIMGATGPASVSEAAAVGESEYSEDSLSSQGARSEAEASIAGLVAARREELISAVSRRMANAISSMSSSDALAIRLGHGEDDVRTIHPGLSMMYLGGLLAFMRGKPYKSCTVDSYVTPVAVGAAEEAITEFYTSPEIVGIVAQELSSQIEEMAPVEEIVRGEISQNADWLKKEAVLLVKGDAATTVAVEAANAATEQISHFLQTAAGKKMLAAIAHALSTTAGKIALKNLVIAVVKKVAASTALKAAIISTLKRVSLAALMKTVVGKAVLAGLALIGLAKIPVAWVILPIIIFFLALEYRGFPAKLASKVPSQVAAMLRGQFEEINQSVVHSFVNQTWTALRDEMTKPIDAN